MASNRQIESGINSNDPLLQSLLHLAHEFPELMARYENLLAIADIQQQKIAALEKQNKIISRLSLGVHPSNSQVQLENRQLKETLVALMNENHQLKSQLAMQNSSVTLPSGTIPPDEGAIDPKAIVRPVSPPQLSEYANITFYSASASSSVVVAPVAPAAASSASTITQTNSPK